MGRGRFRGDKLPGLELLTSRASLGEAGDAGGLAECGDGLLPGAPDGLVTPMFTTGPLGRRTGVPVFERIGEPDTVKLTEGTASARIREPLGEPTGEPMATPERSLVEVLDVLFTEILSDAGFLAAST